MKPTAGEAMEPMPVRHVFEDHGVPSCKFGTKHKAKRVSLIILLALALGVIGSLKVDKSHATFEARPVTFQCPSAVFSDPGTYDVKFIDEHYHSSGDANKQVAENMTEFLRNFRNDTFDAWDMTYDEVKRGAYDWKSSMFADNVNEGDSIYETACGIGLNLFMTLEILNEVKGLSSLVVYGNDYLIESAWKANLLFDHGAPFETKKGTFCAGDSSHLAFVPSDSFDLVFTGYLPPLSDPLGLHNRTVYKGGWVYADICNGKDWKSQKLAEIAQERRNHFAAMIVGEMIRIAKPGKAVIVECIPLPECDDQEDWGGVSRDWWITAIDQYGWDVDPGSLTFGDDPIYGRYHVFMRKNNA